MEKVSPKHNRTSGVRDPRRAHSPRKSCALGDVFAASTFLILGFGAAFMHAPPQLVRLIFSGLVLYCLARLGVYFYRITRG